MNDLRAYTVGFGGASVALVQDLIAIYCGASMAIELQGVELGQITGVTVQNLAISIKRLPSVVTAGSAGGAGTIRKVDDADSAATVTARINDTTPATSSGTIETLHRGVFNIVNGYQFFWPKPLKFGLSKACVLSLDTAPTGPALSMSGTLYFAERF